MSLNGYQQLSKRTMPQDFNNLAKTNYALGIAGEAGEVADIVKKNVFHGHAENTDEIKKELGDVMHYVAGLATMYGLTLEEVARANIDKLKKRYPNGFSESDSINREL